jgi:simple sugar transport system substrate-binding protein
VDIIIIAIDAVKLAFEAIIAGDMNVTVECSPLMGPTVVDVIRQHSGGGTPEKTIFNNVRVFDETLYPTLDWIIKAADDLANRVY